MHSKTSRTKYTGPRKHALKIKLDCIFSWYCLAQIGTLCLYAVSPEQATHIPKVGT